MLRFLAIFQRIPYWNWGTYLSVTNAFRFQLWRNPPIDGPLVNAGVKFGVTIEASLSLALDLGYTEYQDRI